MQIKDENYSGTVVGKEAVEALKEITLRRISEKEKTRRLLIVITAVIILCAAAIMIFSPQERQTTSTIIGFVLIILALGSIGASQFALKVAGWEISTLEKNIQLKSDSSSASKTDEKVKSEKGYTMAQ